MFRKFTLTLAGVLSAALVVNVPLEAQQPPVSVPAAAKAKPIPVAAPTVAGGKVVLVPRDQLRAGPGVKTARLHPETRKLMSAKAFPIPAEWDWTKNGSILLPILGNNQYGDCYYAAPCHVSQLMMGMNGTPVVFDVNAVIKRYLKLSGGDNGLDDSTVFPEFKAGIVGPNGPHKILDVLIVSSTDTAIGDLTSYAFGPQMFTFTVYSNFMNVKAGTVLDGSTGGIQGGHAVVFSGKKTVTVSGQAAAARQLETWGIQPSVLVTQRWINSVQPETVAVFSLEWFNSQGFAPNGQHYTTLAALWNSMGGHVDPVGPFPAPTPTPPVPPIPVPPTPTPTPTPPAPGSIYVGPPADTLVTVYDANGKIIGQGRIMANSITSQLYVPKPAATLSLDVVFALLALYQDVRASGNGTLIADWNAMTAALKARSGMLPAIEKFALDLVAAGTDPKVLADLERLATDLGIVIPFNSPLKTGKPYPVGVPKLGKPGAALPRGNTQQPSMWHATVFDRRWPRVPCDDFFQPIRSVTGAFALAF